MRRHFKLYCDEYWKIENYDLAEADNFIGWECHHRLELTINREFAHSHESLKRLNMYYHRPYFELIFLKEIEHNRLHLCGKTYSKERRQNISNSLKGKPKSEEHVIKMSLCKKGRHWYNNGIISKQCFECPPGFVKGRI